MVQHLLRRMDMSARMTSLVLISLMALGVGCSSSKPESAAPPTDPVQFNASSTTSSELGVTKWGIRAENTSTVVRGYDASGTAMVEFHQKINSGEPRTFEATLKTGAEQAAMKVEIESSGVRMLDNAFANDDKARHVIDRIIADLDAQSPQGDGTLLGTKTLSLDLKLRDGLLTDGGTCLTTGCTTSLYGAASSGAKAVSACQSGDPSTCSAGVDQASNAQGQTDSQCGSPAVARAMQWVNVKMPYCGGVNGGPDALCPGTCVRTGESKTDEWDKYRSDCSGLVSWAWGLPPPGLTTLGLAPFATDASKTISVDELTSGDALNCDTHVMLFDGWEGDDHTKIRVVEEYDCGQIAESRVHNVSKASDTTLNIDGRTFTAIRHTGSDPSCSAGPPPSN